MGGIIVIVIIAMSLSYFIIRDAVAEGILKALEEYNRLKENQKSHNK